VNATLVNESPVVHEHHERLVHHVDRLPQTGDLIDGGQLAELSIALTESCSFLNDLLLPHMAASEKAIYPELERMLQNRHSMTPMRREHEQIRAQIAEIDLIRLRLDGGTFNLGDRIRLRRAIFGLYSLLKVHLAEELLYADMVEHGASPERAAALAAAMEHTGRDRF
jgi:Hemerythrin HHE cation binding domain